MIGKITEVMKTVGRLFTAQTINTVEMCKYLYSNEDKNLDTKTKVKSKKATDHAIASSYTAGRVT